MKTLYFFPFIILFFQSSIVHSTQYESVGECVLEIMKERNLTGNKMFDLVMDECERIIKNNGILYWNEEKGNKGWIKNKSSGGKYVGEIKDNLPHGFGTFIISRTGFKYVGEWKQGLYDGKGKYSSDSGQTYDGYWNKGKFHGEGKLVTPSFGNRLGRTYEGKFRNDFEDGEGKEIKTNGESYEGYWKKGEYHGYGVKVYPDGDKYIGEWKKGRLWNGEKQGKDERGEYILKMKNGTYQ